MYEQRVYVENRNYQPTLFTCKTVDKDDSNNMIHIQKNIHSVLRNEASTGCINRSISTLYFCHLVICKTVDG